MSRKPKPSGRKRPFDKGRRAEEYARSSRNLRAKRLILIVCEAKETEPNYFTSFYNVRRPASASIKVLRGGQAKALPARTIERAKQERDQLLWDEHRDQAWCVFDTEQAGTHADLLALVKDARRYQLHVAISNPAFEYWFLLHFEQTDRPFGNAQELTDVLRGHLPQYTKSMDAFARLDELTENALANAKALRKRSGESWENYPCPSTGADLLVREILRR